MKSGRAHNSREKTVAASCEKRIFREMFAHARERNRKVPFLHSFDNIFVIERFLSVSELIS